MLEGLLKRWQTSYPFLSVAVRIDKARSELGVRLILHSGHLSAEEASLQRHIGFHWVLVDEVLTRLPFTHGRAYSLQIRAGSEQLADGTIVWDFWRGFSQLDFNISRPSQTGRDLRLDIIRDGEVLTRDMLVFWPLADAGSTLEDCQEASEAPPTQVVKPLGAVVVGNQSYPKNALTGAVPDATRMYDTLRGLGFEGRCALLQNVSADVLKACCAEFVARLGQQLSDPVQEHGESGVALFYFAGHGVEVDGKYQMVAVPVLGTDGRPGAGTDNVSVEDSLLKPLERLKVAQGRKALCVLVFETCRQVAPGSASSSSSVAPPADCSSPAGKLRAIQRFKDKLRGVTEKCSVDYALVWACGLGRVVMEGPGYVGGQLTKALVDHLGRDDSIWSILQRVGDVVRQRTGNTQRPCASVTLGEAWSFRPADLRAGGEAFKAPAGWRHFENHVKKRIEGLQAPLKAPEVVPGDPMSSLTGDHVAPGHTRITSEDGLLTVDVPDGASAHSISVRRVSDEAELECLLEGVEGDRRSHIYQLEPSGVLFRPPVVVRLAIRQQDEAGHAHAGASAGCAHIGGVRLLRKDSRDAAWKVQDTWHDADGWACAETEISSWFTASCCWPFVSAAHTLTTRGVLIRVVLHNARLGDAEVQKVRDMGYSWGLQDDGPTILPFKDTQEYSMTFQALNAESPREAQKVRWVCQTGYMSFTSPAVVTPPNQDLAVLVRRGTDTLCTYITKLKLGVLEEEASEAPPTQTVEPLGAVVVGNESYPNALTSAVPDATRMYDTLRGLGFENRCDLLQNVSADVLKACCAEFVARLGQQLSDTVQEHGESGVALFYFAGHGVEVDGKHQMVPVPTVGTDGRPVAGTDNVSVEDSLLKPLEKVKVAQGRKALCVLVFETCRQVTPGSASSRSSVAPPADGSSPPGKPRVSQRFKDELPQVTDSVDYVVVWACASGRVVAEAPGYVGGQLTKALVDRLGRDDSIWAILQRVGGVVCQSTEDTQRPCASVTLGEAWSFRPTELRAGGKAYEAPAWHHFENHARRRIEEPHGPQAMPAGDRILSYSLPAEPQQQPRPLVSIAERVVAGYLRILLRFHRGKLTAEERETQKDLGYSSRCANLSGWPRGGLLAHGSQYALQVCVGPEVVYEAIKVRDLWYDDQVEIDVCLQSLPDGACLRLLCDGEEQLELPLEALVPGSPPAQRANSAGSATCEERLAPEALPVDDKGHPIALCTPLADPEPQQPRLLAGMQICSEDNLVQLDIPADAATETLVGSITIRPVTDELLLQQLQEGLQGDRRSAIYALEPHGLLFDQAVTVRMRPTELHVHQACCPSHVDTHGADSCARSITMLKMSFGGTHWDALDTWVDEEGNIIASMRSLCYVLLACCRPLVSVAEQIFAGDLRILLCLHRVELTAEARAAQKDVGFSWRCVDHGDWPRDRLLTNGTKYVLQARVGSKVVFEGVKVWDHWHREQFEINVRLDSLPEGARDLQLLCDDEPRLQLRLNTLAPGSPQQASSAGSASPEHRAPEDAVQEPAPEAPPALAPLAALVIGIGAYPDKPLPGAVLDAGRIYDKVGDLGWTNRRAIVQNAGGKELKACCAQFIDWVRQCGAGWPSSVPCGVLFVYVAGHGVERRGRNYLLPVDGGDDVGVEEDLLAPLNSITVANGGKLVCIVVLDTCREDLSNATFRTGAPCRPDPERVAKGSDFYRNLNSSSRTEFVVLWACDPGRVAGEDAESCGSYVCRMLKEHLGGDQRIWATLSRLASGVRQRTGDTQRPWTEVTPTETLDGLDFRAESLLAGSAWLQKCAPGGAALPDFKNLQANIRKQLRLKQGQPPNAAQPTAASEAPGLPRTAQSELPQLSPQPAARTPKRHLESREKELESEANPQQQQQLPAQHQQQEPLQQQQHQQQQHQVPQQPQPQEQQQRPQPQPQPQQRPQPKPQIEPQSHVPPEQQAQQAPQVQPQGFEKPPPEAGPPGSGGASPTADASSAACPATGQAAGVPAAEQAEVPCAAEEPRQQQTGSV